MILEHVRITHEITTMKEKIKENKDKVKVNKTLPYLVANVIELLDVEGDDHKIKVQVWFALNCLSIKPQWRIMILTIMNLHC